MAKAFYCAKCWQQFDEPKEHNRGSWFGSLRLDGGCKGDIRRSDSQPRPRGPKPVNEKLDLDAGEPLKIK